MDAPARGDGSGRSHEPRGRDRRDRARRVCGVCADAPGAADATRRGSVRRRGGVEGGGVQVGDAAAGIFTGTAFDRVWDVGTLTEKWATVLLLTCAVAGSFVFTTTLRQLLYVF